MPDADESTRSVSVDFDAYRRSRTTREEPRPLIAALDRLPLSSDLGLTISRIIDQTVPTIWAGCEIEYAQGDTAATRFRASGSIPAHPATALIHQTLESTPPEGADPLGITITAWRADGGPDANDHLIAGTLIRLLAVRARAAQATAAASSAREHAAQLVVDGITGRRLALAIGVLMHRDQIDEHSAEQRIRSSAAARRRTVQDEAFHVLETAATERDHHTRSSADRPTEER